MEAAERRGDAPEIVRFAGLTLNAAGRALLDAGGRDIALRRSEFDLLLVLARNAGRVLSRDALLNATAGRHAEPFDRSVDVLVSRLRQKIEPDPAKPSLVVTVPGIGYKFAAKPVSVPAPILAEEAPIVAVAPPPPELCVRPAERRQVTVLRCALDGYAAMAARLDPEDLRGVVGAYHRGCADIIERFGGFLAHRTGGDVTAYFGYPRADEHDAERAIRAGLAIVAAARLDAEAGAFPARVGIATGDVLIGDILGDGAAREHAALGEAPDLAARLMMVAEPGTIVIADGTRRLVGELFAFVDQACGNGSAVIGERAVTSRFEALHAGGLTTLVGREEELALLLRRWERSKLGAGRLVHVVAEPGIGKSRLVREFRGRLACENHRTIELFCSPLHRDVPYHPFIRHIETEAGLARSDDPARRLGKLETLFTASDEKLVVPLLADLISIPTEGSYPALELSPRQRRVRIAEAMVAHVLGAAQGENLLLIFEDLHWIDPTSREIFEALIERIDDRHVLAIVTSRPEFVPVWPSQVAVDTLPLGRLDDGEVADMVAEVARRDLPAKLRGQVVERADGVPLFVEELTKAVVERMSDDNTAAPDVSLPASLHDSLMARLDRLPAAKAVAQIGAVIGRSFAYDLVAALAPQPDAELRRALDDLVGSGLVTLRGSATTVTYMFKHALVQSAAYESLLRSRRAAIHERIVAYFVVCEPDIETTDPALLAHHCEQAGLAEKAINYREAAGFIADCRGAYAEMGEQFGHVARLATQLADAEAAAKAELRAIEGLAVVAHQTRGHASAESVELAARGEELCAQLGYPKSFVGTCGDSWRFHVNRGHIAHSLALAERLIRWAEERSHLPGRIMGHLYAAYTHCLRGAFSAARECLEQWRNDWAIYEPNQASPRVVMSTGKIWEGGLIGEIYSGAIAAFTGYPDSALAHLAAAEALAGGTGLASAPAIYGIMITRFQIFLEEPRSLLYPIEQMLSAGQAQGMPLSEGSRDDLQRLHHRVHR